MDKFKYIVAYTGGTEMVGVTDDWVPCRNMNEVLDTMNGIKKEHGFWKMAVCQIIQEHES